MLFRLLYGRAFVGWLPVEVRQELERRLAVLMVSVEPPIGRVVFFFQHALFHHH